MTEPPSIPMSSYNFSNIVFLLMNLMKISPCPSPVILEEIIPFIVLSCQYEDDKKYNGLWCLAYLLKSHPDRTDIFSESILVEDISHYLSDSDPKVVAAMLKILEAVFCSKNSHEVSKCVSKSFFTALRALLKNEKSFIVKHAYYLVLHLADQDVRIVDRLCDSPLIMDLMFLPEEPFVILTSEFSFNFSKMGLVDCSTSAFNFPLAF